MEENKFDFQGFQNHQNFNFAIEFFNQNFCNVENLFFSLTGSFYNFNSDKCEEIPRKRGRKKLRPYNPTKTEVMDKFWLRGFREYIRVNFDNLRKILDDTKFWVFFCGKNGIPGKKGPYLSYSKAYKNYLFSNQSFCKMFVTWSCLYSLMKRPRKNFKGNWDFYYEYLFAELVQNCKYNTEVEEIKRTAMILLGL
jgi:hypothetical protein